MEISNEFCPDLKDVKALTQIIKKTEQNLGDWHDRIVILSNFNEYLKLGGAQLFPPPDDAMTLTGLIDKEIHKILRNVSQNLEIILNES